MILAFQDPAVTGTTLGIEYLFGGFQPPINANALFTGKSLPVKIKIGDVNGAPVTNATPYVYFANAADVVLADDPTNVTTGLNFDYGNLMRYDPTANQYVYNWDLSTTTTGTKSVWVDLQEGTCADPRQVNVAVQRKK